MNLLNLLTLLQLNQSQVQNFSEIGHGRKFEFDNLCEEQFDYIIKGAEKGAVWADYVLNSWGNIAKPSGFYAGNLYDFGSFDQCLSFEHNSENTRVNRITGKYCTLMIPWESQRQGQSFRFMPPMENSSNSLKIGICVPASCTGEQVTSLATRILKAKNLRLSTDYSQSDYCTSKDEHKFEFSLLQISSILLFAAYFLIVIGSTIYEIYCLKTNRRISKTLSAFSVFCNSKAIFSMKPTSTKEITCINGIRALSVIWIIICHNYLVTYWQVPLINGSNMIEWFKEIYSMLILSGEMGVDSFFLLSGLLLTTSVLGQFDKNGKINLLNLYVKRYLRITPPFGAAILFTVSFLYYTGNGPIWPITKYSAIDSCEKYWWTSLLYIQNYYNPGKLCFGHSWYLMVDMQLYILSPIILYPLWKFREKFLAVLVILIFGIMGCTFTVFLQRNFSIAFHKETLDQTRLIYTATHIRMNAWLIGVLLGYLVYRTSQSGIRLSKRVSMIGWTLSISTILLIVFGQYNLQQFDYNSTSNVIDAFYEPLRRVFWALSLGWIILACMSGNGGLVNKFLSLPLWRPISNLSYSLYLLHLPFQLVMMASLKTPAYFNDLTAIHKFWGDFGITFLLSWVWSLAFEYPILNLSNIYLRK